MLENLPSPTPPPTPAHATPEPIPAPAPAERAPERLNYVYHAIIGVAMGVVAIFTAFAWVPAFLTGVVIGRAGVEQSKGIKASGSTQVLRVLAVTGGVLLMLFLGAIIGGLIAFLVAALASFSERVAANTTPTDQTIARILVGLITLFIWFGAIYVLRLNLSLNFGG